MRTPSPTPPSPIPPSPTRPSPGRARPTPARPVRDPSPYGILAARTLAAVGVGALLLAGGVRSTALVVLAVITVLAFDPRHLFSLKNFLLTYTILVFGVGGEFLHLTDRPIYVDIVAYTLVFLAAYAVASIPGPASEGDTGGPIDGGRSPVGRGPLSLVALEYALLTLIGLNLAFLAFQFLKYGVLGYYQGQGLLDQALTYGKASGTGGAEQIIRFALSDGAVGLVILYVKACFESATPIRYRYPAALFVALPILSLSRFNAVVGAVTLLAIFACDRRLTARPPLGSGATSATPPVPAAHRVSRAALVMLGLVLAVATAAFVASIRGGFTSKAGGVGSTPDTVAMFTSELSPVQAYGDIKANIGVLGHPHSKTIVLPLLLKIVPRAWYPNKPLNSGAYYMSTVRPAEWAAGFALPPTYYGDAYLNFGFVGALLAALLLGVVAARLDFGYRRVVIARIPWFLLAFANFYALMRDPVSDSLAGIALTLLVWAVGNRVFRPLQLTAAVG